MYMLILNFTYPLRCLRVPPVEYHCLRQQCAVNVNRNKVLQLIFIEQKFNRWHVGIEMCSERSKTSI